MQSSTDAILIFVAPFMLAQIRKGTRKRVSVGMQKGYRPMFVGNKMPHIIYDESPQKTVIETGMLVRFCNGDNWLDVQVKNVAMIGKPTNADARAEGFETVKSLIGFWRKYGLDDGDIVWGIDFELVNQTVGA